MSGHDLERRQPSDSGLVWQPYAMGGGQWVVPQTVRLCDSDIDRIARRVVELLTSTKDAT